jgi:protein O-GlcNAc transferase
VDRYRRRFAEGLERLRAEVSLDTAEGRRGALDATGAWSNSYLSYQGLNDLELQTSYGEFLHRILASNFPEWAVRPERLPRGPGWKCRVGYVSQFDRAISRFFLGWIRHAAKDRIEIFCYQPGQENNPATEECRAAATSFYQSGGGLEDMCRRIVADRLDVLVYPDLGVTAQGCQLAALRLAPVQCAALAHPMTSGLPTMDYFLSSSAMEAESAREHYSETLIRLPNLGICLDPPVLPKPLLSRTRQDFQLRTDAAIYLCCQSLCKYLPRYDYIFAEIAKRVNKAQFLFFEETGRGEVFRRRLAKAFQEAGLRAEQYCTWLPHVDQFTFWNLNILSDVFLDSIGWSGGNTTLDAIACGLPIVTCPGELLRGRQSYGMLQVLGVTDTVAHNEPEYIEAACRLGTDEAWRSDVRKRMAQGWGKLFGDRECVAALDEFLIHAEAG